MSDPWNPPAAPRRRYCRAPGYISVSTIQDLGRNFSDEEKEKFEKQLQLTRRSTFKNLRGRAEAVWPPHVEAALLQGLSAYALIHGERERSRGLKKVLNRNKFISRFILDATNQVRTSKQVSSRLQQLRGTTQDERVLGLILRRAVKDCLLPLASIGLTPATGFWSPEIVRIPVTVESRSARFPSLPPEIVLVSSPQCIQLRTLAEWQPSSSSLRGMDPTVVLLAPTPLTIYSTLEVYRDNKLYLSSISSLVPDGIHDGKWRYITSIAAEFWQEISSKCFQNGRRTEWSISQLIFGADDSSVTRNKPIVEVCYNFEPPAKADLDHRYSTGVKATKVKQISVRTSISPQVACTRTPSRLSPLPSTEAPHFVCSAKSEEESISFAAEGEEPRPLTLLSDFYSPSGPASKQYKQTDARPTPVVATYSSLSDWNNLQQYASQRYVCQSDYNTQSVCRLYGYTDSGYYIEHPVYTNFESPSYLAVADADAIDSQHHRALLPAGVYSMTGEFMGCYPALE